MASETSSYFSQIFGGDIDGDDDEDSLQTNTLSNSSRWVLKGGIIALFLAELLLALYIWHRQRLHVNSTVDVPRIVGRYDDGLFDRNDIDSIRAYVVKHLYQESIYKAYYVTLWILMIACDGISLLWQASLYLSWSLWSTVAGSVIGTNAIFALLCFFAAELPELVFSLTVAKWSHERSWWYIVKYSGTLLRDIFKNLGHVGPSAVLVTWAAMVLEGTTVMAQWIILTPLVCLYVLLVPTWDIWYLHKNNSQHQQEQYNNNNNNRTDKSMDIVKSRLYRLCDRVGFPRDQLFIYSSPDHQTAAYYYGFLWFRRVVVYKVKQNKVLEKMFQIQPQEVEALVAHELGHWYYSHCEQTLLIYHFMNISTLALAYWLRSNQTILQLFLLSSSSSSVTDNQAATYLPGAIVVFYIILRWYYSLLGLMYHIHSHVTEHKADIYAGVELGYHKVYEKALTKIIFETLFTFPSGDPYYQLCYHNHPSLVKRLTMLDSEYESKRNR